jgi:hypothetical protein
MTNIVEKDLADVGEFFKTLVLDIAKAKNIFETLAPEVKAVFVPIMQLVVTAVQQGATAAAAAGGLNVALDVAVVAKIEAIIQLVIAGDKALVNDFKSLGIKL